MKLSRLFLCLAFTSPAWGDVVLHQHVTGPQGEHKIVTFIKDQKIRTDVGDKTSTIVDTLTGDSITMMHATKQALRVDGAKVKAMQKAMSENANAAPKPVKTGQTEKINGRECEIWTIEMQGVKSTFWIDKHYPDYDRVKQDLEAMTKGMSQGMETTDFDGMVVKVKAEVQGQVTEVLLDSAKVESVDGSQFVVPEGYKDFGLPQSR